MSALFFLVALLVLVIVFLLLAHEFLVPVIIFLSTPFFLFLFLFEAALLVPVVVFLLPTHEFLARVVAVRSRGWPIGRARSRARLRVDAPDDSYQDDHDNGGH